MTGLIQTSHNPWIVLLKQRLRNFLCQNVVLKLFLIPKSSLKKYRGPNLRTNLGDHGNHGTQWLLSICVIHYHLLTKVTEELAAKQNI